MMNKKIKLFGLAAATLLALAGCSEVVAKPQDYGDNLINPPATYTDEIYHNVASVVYDAIHEGGIGSKVLDEVLYIYAVGAFGDYETLTSIKDDDAKIAEFVKTHKAYWDDDREDETADASKTEINRVKYQLKTINDKVAKTMYEKISGGSYSDRHIFSEAKFLYSLRSNLAEVADPSATGVSLFTGQILPEVEPEDVFDSVKGFLHYENYQGGKFNYIEKEIMPGIYKGLLSSLYLTSETYNTLGRSYARKVNIIKIPNNSNYPNAAFYLASSLVAELNDPEKKVEDVLSLFKSYSNASIGAVASGSKEANILNNAHVKNNTDFNHVTLLGSDVQEYWTGTEYGDLAAKYLKAIDTTEGINSSLLSNFTNSGAYPAYIGLEQQTMALVENDYTTTGWFLKNGGLSSVLPDSIRERLFNIGVANGVKESKADRAAAERTYSDGAWHEAENENSYVCRINGHNFLKTSSRINGESIEKDILHYNADDKCYYIIEIEEAVSSSKLSKTSSNNYAHTREDGDNVMQGIVSELASLVGDSDNYSTLATKKYLKEMAIEYHDQTVYDYFKSNYPELFE